jgi:hypothetical protein
MQKDWHEADSFQALAGKSPTKIVIMDGKPQLMGLFLDP